MNTDCQLVAAGTISPINTNIAESTDDQEVQRYQTKRDSQLQKKEPSTAVVDITTEFPCYQSLGDGAWRHQLVERIYQAVVACTTSRLEQLNPRDFCWPPKMARVHLAWDRLHDNGSGKPVYLQRWHIHNDHVALLGYTGRLGVESFADIILATWHARGDDAEARRTHEID